MQRKAPFRSPFWEARGVFGEAAKPFEAKLQARDGEALWSVRAIQDREADRVKELSESGLTVRDIAEETGLSKSKVSRMQAALRARGDDP